LGNAIATFDEFRQCAVFQVGDRILQGLTIRTTSFQHREERFAAKVVFEAKLALLYQGLGYFCGAEIGVSKRFAPPPVMTTISDV